MDGRDFGRRVFVSAFLLADKAHANADNIIYIILYMADAFLLADKALSGFDCKRASAFPGAFGSAVNRYQRPAGIVYTILYI